MSFTLLKLRETKKTIKLAASFFAFLNTTLVADNSNEYFK